MTNRWLKILSIFLSLVLTFNLLPLSILVSGINDTQKQQLSDLSNTSILSLGKIGGQNWLNFGSAINKKTAFLAVF